MANFKNIFPFKMLLIDNKKILGHSLPPQDGFNQRKACIYVYVCMYTYVFAALFKLMYFF